MRFLLRLLQFYRVKKWIWQYRWRRAPVIGYVRLLGAPSWITDGTVPIRLFNGRALGYFTAEFPVIVSGLKFKGHGIFQKFEFTGGTVDDEGYFTNGPIRLGIGDTLEIVLSEEVK